MTDADAPIEALGRAAQEASNAVDAEVAVAAVVSQCFDLLGDRTAHERPGALRAGESQYFVAGAFIVTPDTRYHMLVGNRGFPPEQRRLMIPIDAGHPGTVFKRRQAMILENTDEHGQFRQYLKTSRMGSALYAPMLWQDRFVGQLVMAAQARHTLRPCDLSVLQTAAGLCSALWQAHDGPAWLALEYPPDDAFQISEEGLVTKDAG